MVSINYAEIFGKKVSYDELEEQELLQSESAKQGISEDNPVIKKYQGLLDSGKTFEFTFSGITKKSALFSYEDDVRIMLPTSTMGSDMRAVIAKGRTAASALVGVPIKVKVSSIRRDGEYGAVVFLRSGLSDKQVNIRNAKAALNVMIDNKDKTKIPAKVVTVDLVRRLITLDIGGYGIRAYCKAEDWGAANITEVTLGTITPGMVVGVRVVAKPMWKNADGIPVSKSKAGAYRCVRVNDAPYKGLASRFPIGTTVVARLEKKFDAHAFYAIEGFNDVHIMCYHPWLRDGKWGNATGITQVHEGVAYRICVTEVDEAKKLFRGRLVGVVKPIDDVSVNSSDTK